MTNSWEKDNCAAMKAHYAVYSIPQAAALWCGVPEEQIPTVIKEAEQLSPTGLGRSIWTHPTVPCLEPRSRAVAEAIEDGSLPHGREDGQTVASGEHVAYERRNFFGRDLRKWMEKAFPNEKPAFLFDDIERNSHSAISADAYRILKADRDALATRIEKAKTEYQKLRQEKEDLERINQSLEATTEKMNVPVERAGTTYLNIIGAMLDLMLGKSPGGQAHPTRCSPTRRQSFKPFLAITKANRGSPPELWKRNLQKQTVA
ncbi:hypothetical protein MNBD_GAMMA25-2196 [hydrothermal vent metagenome]|uniref:Uncharacterized protein n=1 Tax=hydrothermal vent metagenome TaxID=652676 RepID=A0A3B1BBK7_9ZZZZ